MAYFAGRQGSTSSSAASSDDDRDDFESNFPSYQPQDAGIGDTSQPRKKHAFLKSASETTGMDDGQGFDEAKMQSKYERHVENIDDALAELAQGRGNNDWRMAHGKWTSMQADLRYVAANGAKLPYSFLSTLADTKSFFDNTSMSDLREETPREQRKHLADFHRDLMEAYEQYKGQIARMDESDDSDNQDESDDEAAGRGRRITERVFLEGEVITEELVAKRLQEIRSNYGKKGTKRATYVDQLIEIMGATQAFPRVQATVGSLLVSANLDAARKSGALSPSKWYEAAKYLTIVLNLIRQHPTAVKEQSRVPAVAFNKTPLDATKQRELELEEMFTVPVTASVLTSRMLEEYLDGVRNTEVYTDTYLQWLRAESTLVKLLQQARALYLNDKESAEAVCQLTMNLLELIYYRQSVDHEKLIEKYGSYDIVTKDLGKSVRLLNDYVQKHGKSQDMKFHATLCVIYHLALHQDLNEATSLFSSSRSSERVAFITDASVRLMYNRVLAQLSILHFRTGNLQEAGNTVMNLFSLPKYRELLGQVLPRNAGRDRVEKALRTRFVPRHMHLNAEILDVVFYLYCMVYRPKDTRIFVYRQFLSGYDRQQFLGPPENSRECVYAAVKAYRVADWESCERYIKAVPVWAALSDENELPFLFPILRTIRVECLKNFILQSKSSYQNIHVQHLSVRFQLPIDLVRFTISQLLLNRDISGVWDTKEDYLHLETVSYTTVEQALLDLADKATMLTEFTERVQDSHENMHHHSSSRGGGDGHRRGTRAPVARQLTARNPFASLRVGGRGSGSAGNSYRGSRNIGGSSRGGSYAPRQ